MDSSLRDALKSAQRVMVTNARDWASDPRDAWLWGILCGWPEDALTDVADRLRWSDEDRARLRAYRRAVAQCLGEDDDDDG